jgi:hypothetical protein
MLERVKSKTTEVPYYKSDWIPTRSVPAPAVIVHLVRTFHVEGYPGAGPAMHSPVGQRYNRLYKCNGLPYHHDYEKTLAGPNVGNTTDEGCVNITYPRTCAASLCNTTWAFVCKTFAHQLHHFLHKYE